MVVIKNKIYYQSVLYVFLTVVFGILAYLFLDIGFTTETKNKVRYQDMSDVIYRVNYKDTAYTSNEDNGRYIASMVDDIDIEYQYSKMLSEYVSGYYKYNVEGSLIAYEDDITDSLWEKKYEIASDKVVLVDQNNVNSIKIEDSVTFDFAKYRKEIQDFIDSYDIEISGYFQLRINVLEYFSFASLANMQEDSKIITINIPLTSDIFRVSVENIHGKDCYYEFSTKKMMNLVFLVIGVFCLSVSIAMFVMVIRQFKFLYNRQSKYKRELGKLLSRYDQYIVRVNRLYVKKEYNLVDVASFSELMDVCKRKKEMIRFKEVKRGSEALFVIIGEDDAWIYRFTTDTLSGDSGKGLEE